MLRMWCSRREHEVGQLFPMDAPAPPHPGALTPTPSALLAAPWHRDAQYSAHVSSAWGAEELPRNIGD